MRMSMTISLSVCCIRATGRRRIPSSIRQRSGSLARLATAAAPQHERPAKAETEALMARCCDDRSRRGYSCAEKQAHMRARHIVLSHGRQGLPGWSSFLFLGEVIIGSEGQDYVSTHPCLLRKVVIYPRAGRTRDLRTATHSIHYKRAPCAVHTGWSADRLAGWPAV